MKSERSVVVLHHRSYHSTTRLLLHVCFLYYKLLFIFNSAYRLVFKMYPSLSRCFTVFHYHQLIVTFSLHGTVVSALCALLHAPRLLQVAYCTHCICILNCWVNKVKTRGHTAARKTPNTDTRRRKQAVEAATAS